MRNLHFLKRFMSEKHRATSATAILLVLSSVALSLVPKNRDRWALPTTVS